MSDRKKKLRFDDPKKQNPVRIRKGYRRIVVDGDLFQWRFHAGDIIVIIGPDDRRMSWCEGPRYVVLPRDVVSFARAMRDGHGIPREGVIRLFLK